MTEDIRILGVKHTDKRIHPRIDDETERDSPPDVVYHEFPESIPDSKEHVYWLLRKDPASILPNLIYLIYAMFVMRRGFSVDSAGKAHVKSECRIAAERLRNEFDAELVDVGMDRVDLLKERSWSLSFQSWAIFLPTLAIIVRIGRTGNLIFLWGLLILLLISFLHFDRTLGHMREDRDEHLAERISSDYIHQRRGTAYILVGQDHVRGIASHLGSEVSPVCRWLSAEADIAEEET